MDDFIKRLEDDFEEVRKKYKIIWKDDDVRQEAINIISGAGKKREDYRKAFKKLVWENISKKYAHFMSKNINEGKEAMPINAKEIMNVSFKIKKKKKNRIF